MPALNFQKQFAADVEAGKKRQTIRAKRKSQIKAGDRLFLYTGMRTKYCRKLGEDTCASAQTVIINRGSALVCDDLGRYVGIYTGEALLNLFAVRDGFKDWPEMRAWFANAHGLPFEGVLIKW